jgi:hypothetical protein
MHFAIPGTFFTPLWQPKATSQLRLLFALIIFEDILQIIDDHLLLWQAASLHRKVNELLAYVLGSSMTHR